MPHLPTLSPARRLLAVIAVGGLWVRPAAAQDAFGLDPGVSTGLLQDPLTGHSPWRVPGLRGQGGLTTSYASDPVYGCERSPDNGECVSSVAPWVSGDWLVAGDAVGHLWDGRVSVGAGLRVRASTGPGEGLPAELEGTSTFSGAQWEDARVSVRWSAWATQRLAVAPVASVRMDRETHLSGDSLVPAVLDLSPLYGLGNGPAVAVPVGWTSTRVPVSFTAEPAGGLSVSSTDTVDAARDLGLNPLQIWARVRAGTAWQPTEVWGLLAELEGRIRRDDLAEGLSPSVEGRLGARRSLWDDRLGVTALLGTSPVRALGSPGLRAGLTLRYTGRANTALAPPPPPPHTGPVLSLSVRGPDGSTLVPEVALDGAVVEVVPGADGRLDVPVPDTAPHTLTLRHLDHATLEQTVSAPADGRWSLDRVLPEGGGDGVMVLDLQDPTGRPLSAVEVRLTGLPDAPDGTAPIDLGTVCGDCDLALSDLPVGTYRLGLAAPGMAPGEASLRVGTTPPTGPDRTLFLQPPVGQLDLRVVDPGGAPIPGAQVRLVQPSGTTEVPLDAAGRAMPVVAPGRWLVETTAPGRGRQLHELDVHPLIPVTHSLSVQLRPEADDGARLQVEVYDADGLPVSGARVFDADLPLATTGSGGRVVLEGLPPGELEVRVEHPDFQPEGARAVSLAAGEESGASFALGWRPGAVVLDVVSADGVPADRTIRLVGPGTALVERTGPDGRASRVLPPGEWQARLMGDGDLPVGIDFDVSDTRNTRVAMQLVAQPKPAGSMPRSMLAVSVVDEGDTPVEGARVRLGDLALGTTSTRGRLTVSGVPAGDAQLAVEGEFFDPWTDRVEVVADGERQVQASLRSRLGLVELVAVDPDDLPIEAQVRVTGATGRSRLSRLGTDGRRSYRLAAGYWEFAFASERNGFGVEDLSVVREQAAYEVRWVGVSNAPAAVLAPPEKRPVEVQMWSRPTDGPTPGTLRMLGPEIQPPVEVGPDGLWSGALRPGDWEALATAPELGIGGGDLALTAGSTPATLRVDLGEVEVELIADEVSIDDTLYFGLGSAQLEEAARDSLAAVARTLRSTPRVRRVRVEGHADQSGAADLNQRLSEARARAVVDALVALGVAPHRLEAVGYGETRPVRASTGDGAARSRRVVFRVLEVQDAVQLESSELSDGTAR